MYVPPRAAAVSLWKIFLKKQRTPAIFISLALRFYLLNLLFSPRLNPQGHSSSCSSKNPLQNTSVECQGVVCSMWSMFWPPKLIFLQIVECSFNYLRHFSFFLWLKKLLMNLLADHQGETAQFVISPGIYCLIIESAGLRNSYHLRNGLVWLIKEVFLAHRRYQYI